MALRSGRHIFTSSDGVPDAQARFESYLEKHPGAIDIWIGGHTHTNPDDTYGGRSHIEQKWGVTFVNVAAISRYHGHKNISMSRLFTFEEVNVKCRRLRAATMVHQVLRVPFAW